jgi:hypothetical protein
MKEPVWNVGHLMVHGAPMPPDNINCKYMGNIHGKDKFRILAAGLRRVVTAAHLAAGPEAVAQLLAKDYDWDADNWLGGEAQGADRESGSWSRVVWFALFWQGVVAPAGDAPCMLLEGVLVEDAPYCLQE